MVRRSRFNDDIALEVGGPPVLLSNPISAKAKLNETWYQYLARNGLKLTSADNIVVRTCNGLRTDDKKTGWTAELNEPVQQLILKFERAKARYSVMLMFKANLRSPCVGVASTSQGSQGRARGVSAAAVHVPLTRSPINFRDRATEIVQQSRGLVYHTKPNKSPPSPQPRQRRRRHQGPSFVIPTTRGGGGGPLTPENLYRKPRYTPGIINGSPRGSTQNRYGTRFKGLSDKLKQTARISTGGPQNGGGGTRGRGDYEGNLTSGSLVRVKVEREAEVLVEDGEERDVNGGIDLGVGVIGEVENFGVSDSEEEDDNLSFGTALSTEEGELRREGIQVKDVKTAAQERLTDFHNCYFLRMRKEIKDLRKSGQWFRNMGTAPLSCYLLQEIFNF